MYDELFNVSLEDYEFKKITDKEEIKKILNTYMEDYYDINDDNQIWFNKMKELCDKLGYASDMKAYKQNPDLFKGNVADVSMVLRVALTSKSMTPDLHELMSILGTNKIKERFSKFN